MDKAYEYIKDWTFKGSNGELIKLDERIARSTLDALNCYARTPKEKLYVAHPLDIERWNRFVISAFETEYDEGRFEYEIFTYEMLEAILVQKYEWGDDIASNTCSIFDLEISLLKSHKEYV